MSDTSRPGLEAAYSLETPEDNRRLYHDWAQSYDQDFARASGYRLPRCVARAYLAAQGGWPALDAGCGTGLVADHLPGDAVVDGIDISPEMLARARRRGRYRALHAADLTQPLLLDNGAYAGLLSAGTFTHGHVGPAALPELVRVLRPGAVAALACNAAFYRSAGFGDAFARLVAAEAITEPALSEEPIYADGADAPEGHEGDTALIVTLTRGSQG